MLDTGGLDAGLRFVDAGLDLWESPKFQVSFIQQNWFNIARLVDPFETLSCQIPIPGRPHAT
jgi:hypothetical protein